MCACTLRGAVCSKQADSSQALDGYVLDEVKHGLPAPKPVRIRCRCRSVLHIRMRAAAESQNLRQPCTHQVTHALQGLEEANTSSLQRWCKHHSPLSIAG